MWIQAYVPPCESFVAGPYIVCGNLVSLHRYYSRLLHKLSPCHCTYPDRFWLRSGMNYIVGGTTEDDILGCSGCVYWRDR